VTEIRTVAHVHSDWSYDGQWTLPAIAAAFKRRGYRAVLMAEHDRGFDERRWQEYGRACTDASDDELLLVPGIEYEDPDNVVHVPVWGEGVRFLGERRPTLDVLREANEHGAAAVFAHPWRRDAVARHRPEWTPLLSAVEIWNRRYDGIAPNPAGTAFADAEGLAPFVSLDFHSRRQFSPLAMVLELDGGVSTAAIVDALRARRHRAEVFRVPALALTRGVQGSTLRVLERARRSARARARPLRHLVK
jgi:predicted metal-dependent phosphoesterase TrpH